MGTAATHRWRKRGRLGLATVCLALLAATAAGSPSSASPAGPQLDAATTGARSELRRTVPITRRPGRGERIALSMGPGRLAGLRRGDRLDLSSEVQVTVDCTVREARCAGRPYRFDPNVIVTLELAPRRSVKARSRVLARRRLSCGQQEPLREHHCPVVFDHVTTASASASPAGLRDASSTSSSPRTVARPAAASA